MLQLILSSWVALFYLVPVYQSELHFILCLETEWLVLRLVKFQSAEDLGSFSSSNTFQYLHPIGVFCQLY